jgi:hypothetical protein
MRPLGMPASQINLSLNLVLRSQSRGAGLKPRTLRQGRGQGRSKKNEDTLPGVRRIQLRKCLIEISKMTTVLLCDGGLVGGVTAYSIDRSPVSQWQDVFRPSVNHLARRLEHKCRLQRIRDALLST